MFLRIASVPLLAFASMAHAQEPDLRWSFEVESGLSSSRYNRARVPNPAGTDLDLASLVGKQWRPYARLAIAYRDNAEGTWKLLYAPFRQSGVGNLGAPASFDGTSFSAGPIEALYQFNSYRLTYRKPWKGNWSIGGTLKIRDAEIRLIQGSTYASEKNVGFVPLLNIYGEGAITKGFRYEVEMDGLAGGPGRAFDLSLRATRYINPSTTAFIGVRVLEGGADVPRVKNFAWVTYLSAGLTYRF